MESRRLRALAMAGMLAAVGYVLQLFEFPLLPGAAFLKFDFGDIPVVVAGSFFGPGACVITAVVKGLLWVLIGHGANGWVGAGMNTITVIAFALPISLLFRSSRTWTRVLAVVVGTLAMTVVMAGVNRLVDPWYLKMSVAVINTTIVSAIIPFNLLRGAINGVASLLIILALQRTSVFRQTASVPEKNRH